MIAAWLLVVCGQVEAQFFLGPQPLYLGSDALCIATADFNGDANLDLAIGMASGGVTILLGDGAGGFGAPRYLEGPVATAGVAVADLNDDGRMDLAMAGHGHGVAFFLGDGAGGFAQSYTAGLLDDPTAVVAADFDRDGRMDVAVTSFGAGPQDVVTVYRGDGAGAVVAVDPYLTGAGPWAAVPGDFNGDSWPDLAVALIGTNDVSVLIGDGAGGFEPPVAYSVGDHPIALAVADFSGDGAADLAVANQFSNNVSLLLGDGGGSFAPGGSLATGVYPNLVGFADLNGDQSLDLVVAASNAVGVYLGTGGGAFAPPVRYGAALGPNGLVAADFDRDGRVDVLTANYMGLVGDGTVTLLRGDGGGAFAAPRVFAAGPFPAAVVAADLSGDGKLDVAVAGFFGVTVLRGDGSGALASIGTFAAGSGPSAIAFGDLDQDGLPDLAVANDNSATVSILLGTGGGAFAPPLDLAVEPAPGAVSIADLNQDGRNDIAVASSSGTLSILLSTGPAAFGAPVLYAAGAFPRAIAVGYLNNDTRPDVVVANRDSADVSVFLGSGGGGLLPATRYPVGSSPAAVVLADVDGDLALDVAVAGDQGVTILHGDGSGGFSLGGVEGAGFFPVAVGAADLDADSRVDLAVVNDTEWSLTVLQGVAPGDVAIPQHLPAGRHPAGLVLADLNADGRLDAIEVNHDDDSVWTYLGAPMIGGADLSVSLGDSADPIFDGLLTYTMVVSNAGPEAATAVQALNELPQVFQFLSSTPGPPACVHFESPQASELECQFGTLQPGETKTVTIDVAVNLAPSGGIYFDRASLMSHSPDPDPADDSATESTAVNPTDVSVTLSDSMDPVAPGVPFTYQVSITNHAPITADTLHVVDTLPDEVQLLSTVPPAPACLPVQGTVQCTLVGPPPGMSTGITVNVVAPSGFTEVTDHVSVTVDGLDPDLSNNVASETTHGALGYGKELLHGSQFQRSLGGQSVPGEERFSIAASRAASYEVVVDGTSGDLAPLGGALSLERLGPDAVTVLQVSDPVGAGHSRSLRWESASPGAAAAEVIRVRSTGCGLDCDPEDLYRIRAYETTLSGPRFNTTGTQTSVLVLQNSGPDDVDATLWLWNTAGSLAASRALDLPARTSLTLDLATVVPGLSGSLTLSHTARYGQLVGKAVAIEPATGFTFDSPVVSKPR